MTEENMGIFASGALLFLVLAVVASFLYFSLFAQFLDYEKLGEKKSKLAEYIVYLLSILTASGFTYYFFT